MLAGTFHRPRRFRRSPYRVLVIMLVLVVLTVVRWWNAPPPEATPGDPLPEAMYRVVRVVDGDTILFAPDYRVRLIGVNAPESVKPEHPVEPFGPEASEFTRQFLAAGEARLSFDRERVDRFGRFLAYVWVGDLLLNEELIRAGLAHWERHFQYSQPMKDRFRRAEQEARRNGVGIWSLENQRPANEQKRAA